MSAPAGFLTQCAEWLVSSPHTPAQLAAADTSCAAVEADAKAARAVIKGAQGNPKTDCGCSDDSYYCRQPGCPRAEILKIFEDRPNIVSLADMVPDGGVS